MGSVKDLKIINEAEKTEPGIGRFYFSDRYSVFDWGEMPDHIHEKGKSICIVSAYFFEKLEKLGIKTHYRGIIENGKLKTLDELNEPSDEIEFKLLRVIKPEVKNGKYDYSIYKNIKSNFLIPLEVIYRNYLPEGSSVFKRLENKSLNLKDLNLQSFPKPGKKLDKPIIEFSTKLEEKDRYITEKEAKEISFLTDREIEKIKNITLKINKIITEEVKNLNLINEDGKFEFGIDENRKIILVDAVGTLDESRFTYNGFSVSKEILRIYYRKTKWYKEVIEAKTKDNINWKNLVKSRPPLLPKRLKELISLLYKSYANKITKKTYFKTPKLDDIILEIKNFIV